MSELCPTCGQRIKRNTRPWRVEFHDHSDRWVSSGTYATPEKAQEHIDEWAAMGHDPERWRIVNTSELERRLG